MINDFSVTPLAIDLAELLSQVSAGNRLAFAALYGHTHVALYGVTIRILPNKDLAGDVLQETYVRIWQNASRFDSNKGGAIFWMKSIARNRALDELRRVKAFPTVDFGKYFDPAAEYVDPLASRERSESLKAVMFCLLKLDIPTRELIMLAYYRGVSREALSKRFNAPVPTIKTHLRRGLARLKGLIDSVSNGEITSVELAYIVSRSLALPSSTT